jgi:hypothetical protein
LVKPCNAHIRVECINIHLASFFIIFQNVENINTISSFLIQEGVISTLLKPLFIFIIFQNLTTFDPR